MSPLTYNAPRPSIDYGLQIVQRLIDTHHDTQDEAERCANHIIPALLVVRGYRWIAQQLAAQGKRIEDYVIEPAHNLTVQRFADNSWKIILRITADDISNPHEHTVFPAGAYDQASSWWLLFRGEETDTGKPLTCTLSLNAQPIPERELCELTDSKTYSDLDLLLSEFETCFRQDIKRMLDQFNRTFADLPDRTDRAIGSIDHHQEAQATSLQAMRKKLQTSEQEVASLTKAFNSFSWAMTGGFLFLTLACAGCGVYILEQLL